MGPRHPSTHGVLRLILELEGESVTRPAASAIYTPASKRTWSSVTGPRGHLLYPDGLPSPLYQEAAYCLGGSGCSTSRPGFQRSQCHSVLMMELNRISSHLVCIATGGMEIGALTVMTIGFREREKVLDAFG